MNLVYGEVVELAAGDDLQMARIKVGGVIKKASIGLLSGVHIGDRVLLCDGVALAKVEEVTTDEQSNPENRL